MDTRRLLAEFPAYLEANRLARPQHILPLQRWAERYIATAATPSLGPADRLRVLLETLRQNPGVADWQVLQAEGTVRLWPAPRFSPSLRPCGKAGR